VTSLAKRLILTFTSVPALFSLIYFLPHNNHLGFVILTLTAMLVGTYEIKILLFGNESKPLIPFWVASFLPVAQYLELKFAFSFSLVEAFVVLLFLIALCVEIFLGSKDDFKESLNRLSRTFFMIIYPNFFSLYLIRILFLNQSTFLLLMLFLLVFGNDTFAYVFGMWLGKNNRNIFNVSPNKSLSGFIGGFLSTLLISLMWVKFVIPMRDILSWQNSLIIAFVVALASNIGDLAESVFKRSAKVKDSGTIILGRGGILDSIDSLLASAPFFYFMVVLMTK
jgi:phosphatidate cytidylyltransferase